MSRSESDAGTGAAGTGARRGYGRRRGCGRHAAPVDRAAATRRVAARWTVPVLVGVALALFWGGNHDSGAWHVDPGAGTPIALIGVLAVVSAVSVRMFGVESAKRSGANDPARD